MIYRIAPLALLCAACMSTSDQPPAAPGPVDGPTAVVVELYDLVTFDAGTTPDWNAVRALFVEEAVIVLRTGQEMSVFSLEGFVSDFVQFIEQAGVEKTGFTERILGMREVAYGDIAQVLVHFDSQIPGAVPLPREGIDSFELIRRGGDWKIVSITNERPNAERPIPVELFE